MANDDGPAAKHGGKARRTLWVRFFISACCKSHQASVRSSTAASNLNLPHVFIRHVQSSYNYWKPVSLVAVTARFNGVRCLNLQDIVLAPGKHGKWPNVTSHGCACEAPISMGADEKVNQATGVNVEDLRGQFERPSFGKNLHDIAQTAPGLIRTGLVYRSSHHFRYTEPASPCEAVT